MPGPLRDWGGRLGLPAHGYIESGPLALGHLIDPCRVVGSCPCRRVHVRYRDLHAAAYPAGRRCLPSAAEEVAEEKKSRSWCGRLVTSHQCFIYWAFRESLYPQIACIHNEKAIRSEHSRQTVVWLWYGPCERAKSSGGKERSPTPLPSPSPSHLSSDQPKVFIHLRHTNSPRLIYWVFGSWSLAGSERSCLPGPCFLRFRRRCDGVTTRHGPFRSRSCGEERAYGS